MSLTYKLFLSVLISMIISFSVFSIIVISIERNKANEVFYSKIEHNKEIYSASIATLLYTLNEDVIKSILNSVYKDKEIMMLELIDNTKSINIKLDNKKYKSEDLIKSVIPLSYSDEKLGQLIIYYSKEFIVKHLNKYQLIIFTFALLLILLLSVVVYFFINKVSLSLKLLTNASMKIADGDLTKEVNIEREDEIGILSEQFNLMRKSLINRRDTNIKQLAEIKEKDLLLIQQTKMAAMGEMLENIAHQWRQPLSIISTASTGAKLKKDMDCLSDDELDSILININNSAQYLSQTIEDFRSFFNPVDNKNEEFYIEEAISKTLKLLSSQFATKDIIIIENINNFKIVSIQNEIIQILINILNNARDALVIKENQKRLIFINTYKKDDVYNIEIIDNAGGIKNDIIDRIFEPYFTTKHKSLGTGIGLYMSQVILNTHLNGNILVNNERYEYENIEYSGAKFIIKISSSLN